MRNLDSRGAAFLKPLGVCTAENFGSNGREIGFTESSWMIEDSVLKLSATQIPSLYKICVNCY